MSKLRKISSTSAALALTLAAATPPAMMLVSPAMAEPPKSAACQASSDTGEAELARYPDPPQGTEVIVQMQHLLWKLGYIMDLLDGSCRDWGGYETVRQQLQQSYDATMQNCLALASSSSYCHRQRYGG